VNSRLAFLLLSLLALVPRGRAQLPASGNFSRTNLVAWCIVPFDTRKRGPEERAEMLERLGIHRLAYDWRSEHVPTFDAEVAAMRRHGIEITAWWFPAALNEEAKAILACIERNRIHPQLWVTMGTEPETDPIRLEKKLEGAVQTLVPICVEAGRLGCRVGLYNHLGWFGQPVNQIEVLERLRAAGHTNAGMVYNFHHGHAHVDTFAVKFERMKPHLLAVNLNGMVRDGDRIGKKIIPVGTGDVELGLLRIVNASGWRGDVGLIGHTEEDVEVKLRKELDGLERLVPQFVVAAARPAGEPAVSGREPGSQGEKDWVDNRWQQSDVGPFLASTLRLPDGVVVAKGLTVRTAGDGDGAIAYDLATGEVRAAWTEGFLKFDPTRFGLIGAPTPGGEVAFTAPQGKGRSTNAYHYVGLHRGAGGVVLEHSVDGVRILERAALRKTAFGPVFERVLSVASHEQPLRWLAAGHLRGTNMGTHSLSEQAVHDTMDAATGTRTRREAVTHRELGYNDLGSVRSGLGITGVQIAHSHASVDDAGGRTEVTLEPSRTNTVFSVFLWRGDIALWPAFEEFVKEALPGAAPDLRVETSAEAEILTRGVRGADADFLAVDTLTLPYDNPQHALLFASGVDFTPDGVGYLSTIHGDVWRLSGIDAGLQNLRWKRFASGLFQPLGLKVRGDDVYVLGRDRITRLHDSNHDGVAERYESFHDGIDTSTGGHDYVTCLEVDSAGRFYYADPKGVHRVAADGKSAELLAAGFRNPNGMGVSPDGGVVTVAPQQGTWTPSSEIVEVREGGWYGYGGPRKEIANGLGRDWPLCWIPHGVDNSSGSQAWIPAGQWGPLGGQMIHLLWGRCGLMLVLRDTSGPFPQGAVVPLPAKFLSGPNRATFRASEGALYVAGSTGWQTSAVKDGALQRVRFTGKPVRVPVGWKQDGSALEFRFAETLDPSTAGDVGSYAVKRWNYRYSEEYGSKDWSVAEPTRIGRDDVAVKSATVSKDGTSVRLQLADAAPAMQYELRYNVDFVDGGSAHAVHCG
jgi:sugar phosphate isomerase/epimerase